MLKKILKNPKMVIILGSYRSGRKTFSEKFPYKIFYKEDFIRKLGGGIYSEKNEKQGKEEFYKQLKKSLRFKENLVIIEEGNKKFLYNIISEAKRLGYEIHLYLLEQKLDFVLAKNQEMSLRGYAAHIKESIIEASRKTAKRAFNFIKNFIPPQNVHVLSFL